MKKIYYLMFIGVTALLLLGQSGLYAQITSVQSIDAQCFGDNDGKIIMTVLPSTVITGVVRTGPVQGTLMNNNKEIWGLLAGTYNLTVSFAAQPNYTTTIVVNQPTALAFQISYTYDCANMEVPEICATNNGSNTNYGGVPPYDFYWLDNSNFAFDSFINVTSLPCINSTTTPNFIPIDMTNYSGDVELYVYDSKDCFLSQSKIFTAPVVTGTLVATQGVCAPLNSGSLEIQNISGGVTPYTYYWSTGAITTVPTLTGLVPGNYSVTINDVYECASVSLYDTIPNPNDLVLTPALADVNCFGGSDGSISVTVVNGTGPYGVTWEKNGGFYAAGPGLLSISNLGAGTYEAFINDIGTQCFIQEAFTISQPTLLTANAVVGNNVSCFGGNNGSVTANAAGGTSPYGYVLYTALGVSVASNSTGLFTGLAAGEYYVEATDDNQCTAVTANFFITQPAVLNFTPASTAVSCYNGNNGTITLTLSGGTFPFTYLWTKNGNTFAGNNALSNLGFGEYCVTITDANGCTASDCIILTNPSSFTVSLDYVNHVICHGGNDGNIGVSVNGGASPYTYLWKKNSAAATFATTEDLVALQAAVYCLTVTDANSCIATICVTVNEPPPLTILGQVERVSCNGFCDGKVKAIPEGGTPGTIAVEGWTYQYRIYNNFLGTYSPWQVDSFFYSLCPGFYSLEVIDAHNCVSAYPDFEIWEPAELQVLFNSLNNVSCYGGANGSIDVSIVGGTTPYTIEWSNGATTEDVSGLTAGTYSVTVIDDSDCEFTYSNTITQPDELLLSVTKTDVTCCNAADGSVDLTVVGGTSPYIYTWTNGAFTQDLTNLGPGTYCVTVTDFNGCEATICAPTIVEPPCLDAIYSKVDIDCFGNNNGSIDVTPSGGTMPYSYLWLGGQTTQDLMGLAAGNYCLTITDAQGCTTSLCTDILEPSLLVISTTSNNVTCCLAADGTIDLTVSGGTAPYAIAWSNQATTEDLNLLGPGTYCVTVTDAHDCTQSTCVTITEPPCLFLQLDPIDIICNGDDNGEIYTVVDGGTQPYSFLWSNGATTQSIINLSGGTYCLTVTDANGCTISGCATINEPVILDLIETHLNVTCYGYQNGSIDLTISGGNGQNIIAWELNGTFYSNTEDLTNLAPGTYCVTVTDFKGCTDNLCVTITQPPLFEAVVTSYDDITCYGYNNGNIDVTITGGSLPYTILWNNGAITEDLSNIGPGNYCLTVTDANMCMVTLCQQIMEPAIFSIDLIAKTNVSCFGLSNGMINVNVFGGVQPYTYLWSNGAITEDIANLAAGTYCLTATDFNGCMATICIEITQPDLLDVTLVSKVDVDCYGNNNGSIDVSVVGGTMPYTYLWSNSATTQDLANIGPGNYCVTVTDANGCTDNICIDIFEPADLMLNLDASGNITCFGLNNGFINATATGGVTPYTYTWNRDGLFFSFNEDLSGLAPGTYCLTVTDANQCVETMTCVTITQPEVLLATVQATSNVTCYSYANGSIDLSVTGGTTAYSYIWSNGATTQDLINVGPGSYFVTVTDMNGCLAYANATITEPALFEVVLMGQIDVTCFDYSNGSIDIEPNGGTPNYTYMWNDGVTTQDRFNLVAGTYSVTVTDAQGCTASGTWTITQPSQLQIVNPVVTNVTINGGSNGSIDITVTGGTPPYEYLWSNGATTQDLVNIPAGTYSVTVTDFYGCETTGQWIVEEPLILEITIVTTTPPCYDMDNGTIDLGIIGGVSPYTIVWWYNGAFFSNQEDLSNLAPGTYYVTVTDVNGATATGNATITEPDELILSETHVNIMCYGNMTGSVDLTVMGGTAPYTYLWSNGAITQDINGLAAGTYFVTVTDDHNCMAYLSVTITQPPLLVAGVTTYNNVTCYGYDNGNISVTTTGGTQPYTFLWNNGATTEDLINIGPGNYCLTVTDANMCVVTLCQPISQPSIFDISLVAKTDVSCFGMNNGFINVNVFGGVQPYTYLWSNGATTEDIFNLTAGTYCLTATDFNGCMTTICVEILQPDVLDATETHENVMCYGYQTGSINVSVTGGTLSYTYLWSNGATTQDLTGLAAGTYSLTVTDAHGCMDNLSVTIMQPPLLVSGVTAYNNVTCYGYGNGNISVTTSGGTPPYSFSWNNGAITEDLTNIGPGNYCLTVTDANQCMVTLCQQIMEPPVFDINLIAKTDVSCFGMSNGAINVNVFGGVQPYAYLWSNGATTEDISNLAAGTYCLTTTDFNGCMTTICVEILQPDVLDATETHENVMCYGYQTGSINVSVTGGTLSYTYLWSNGATTQDLTGLAAGTYSLTVTDAHGCMDNLSVTIMQPPLLVSGVTAYNNVTCYGYGNGNISVTTSGGTPPYSFSWNNGAITEDLTNIGPGNYCLTVTDANQCMVTLCQQIMEPPVFDINLVAKTDVSCFGMSNGAINVNVYGGVTPYIFSWTNGATTEDISNLAAGTYCLTATDMNGCMATICVEILQPDVLDATETHVNVMCNGYQTGSIDVSVTGGTTMYSYLWSNGATSQDLTGLAAGTYSLTVTDAHGCMDNLSVTITQPPLLVSTINGSTNVSCYGGNNGSIDLGVVGGTMPYSYMWSNGAITQDIFGLSVGMYCVTVTDANSCTTTICQNITQPTPLNLMVYGFVNVDCYNNSNGSIDIMVSGGTTPYNFAWSNGANTEDISGLSPNTYCVTVTDANGCVATACQVITQPAQLLASATETNVTCYDFGNGTVDLTVSGGTTPYYYSWSNGATTQDLANLAPGNYCVTVTDSHNCMVTLCRTITQPAMLEVTGTVVNPLCYGDMNGSINITVTGGTMPYNYNWGNQGINEDLMNLGAGTYCVTVTDANGCVATACYTLTQPDELVVEVYTVVNVDCYNNGNGSIDIFVLGGTTNYTYLWSNGATTQDIMNLMPGTYTVTVTDANGCTATNGATITQPDLLEVDVTVTHIICHGDNNGTLTLSVMGGTTAYMINVVGPGGPWTNVANNSTLTGLGAGTYCVNVTDANGCTASACETITEASALVLDLDVSDLLCLNGNQGAIDLTITGGQMPYAIVWSNGATTEDLDTLVGGQYCVTVTDAFGCVATACGMVDQPLYPLAALYITGENVDCYGANNGWFEVMATGGAAPYQYSLDYAPFTSFMYTPMIYNNLTPGFHLLTIGDSNNCEVLYEIEITEPDPLELTFVWENNDCYGQTNGWIDMSIAGGTLYQYLQTCNCDTTCFNILWSNGATTEDISGLAAGTYTVTVTDCNGCIATGAVVITAPPVLVVTATKVNLDCYGDASGSIDLTVTGGTPPYSYQWSNGATTQDLSGLSGGFYVVTVTDANGCYAVLSVMITEPAPTVLDFNVTNIMCTGVNDGAIDLLLQDSVCLEYHWSNGATTQDINNLAAGWYWVTVIDCNGCVAIDSACVYAPNNPLEISYTVHNVLCYGGNTGWIEIAAIGGTMPYVGIQWTGVVPTDCCGLDTVVLDSVQLWSNGQVTDVIENLEAGTYYVTLTDAYGCEAYAEIVVSQPLCPVNIANYLLTDVDMGVLGAIDIYVCCGTFPYTYYWEYEGAFFANTEDLTNLQSGTYTITVTDANGCVAYGSFVVNSNTYPGWTNGNIETSHTIYIPTAAVSYLSVGDYIGVFYDSLGTMACGGFVKWEGVATTLAAWGDDGIDPSEQTGFLDGELFTWVIWDSGTDTEYAAYPTYDLSPVWPSDSTYEANGISGLTSLAIGNILDVQNLNLHTGWNLISTYINPFLTNVSTVFAPVVSNLIIVKDGNGDIYWPQWSVNTIGSIEIGRGYKVKMSASQTLPISGVLLTPELTPIAIPNQWSIIGYLRTSPANIATLLSSVVSNVVIVKNEDGHVYWPSMFNLNTIGNMVPGKGYQIKMTSGAVLTYAPNGMMSKSGVSSIETKYFKTPANTGSNMTIGIPQSAWPTSPSVGDEIALLNNKGEILGASVYTGDATSINLWGDDALTGNIEGVVAGEAYTLAIWNTESNSVRTLIVDLWAQGDNVYEENAISIVGKFASSMVEGNSFALYQNMPNPFSYSTEIKFSIPTDTYVHIGVYNILGDLIEELVGSEMAAGEYTVTCDGSKLAAGSYLYKIITDDYTASKQMNVIK